MLDPLEDCFRIRMVITLLHTCGHCFDRGSSKRKLDEFLLHFQSYILRKGSIPLDIEFDLQVSCRYIFLQLIFNIMLEASELVALKKNALMTGINGQTF